MSTDQTTSIVPTSAHEPPLKKILKVDDSSDAPSEAHHTAANAVVQSQILSVNNDNEKSEEIGDDDEEEIQITSTKKLAPATTTTTTKANGGSTKSQSGKKKNTSRCKLCKKGGTPSSFKACKECSRAFHLECIGMKKEESGRKYICDGCKEKSKQKRAVEREKEKKRRQKEKEKEKEKQLKIDAVISEVVAKPIPKSTPATQAKDKAKEEAQRLFSEFSSAYPQFVENRKVKYPIEDTLLDVYEKAFNTLAMQPGQNLPARIEPAESVVIPQEYFGDIIMIWNFISTFSEHLDNIKLTKEQVYVLMEEDGSNEECVSIVTNLFKNLIRFPVLDIFYTNKIDNNKELSEQPFFIAARFAKDTEQLDIIMPILWPEFIRNLSMFHQYSLNFTEDEKVDEILQIISSQNFSSFYDLSTAQKIKLLSMVIACVDDSDSFHEGVIGCRQEKVHEMTKERNDLLVEIKKDETDILALEVKLKTLEEEQKGEQEALQNLDNLSRAESLRKQKELEKDKKEFIRQQNALHKAEQQLNKKRLKSQQLSLDLPHFINSAQLLGFDRNKSEYWFFHNERKAIYVRSTTSKWGFFNSSYSIKNLVHSLNKKGIREKSLHENIIYLIKNGYLASFPGLDDIDKKPPTVVAIGGSASQITSQGNLPVSDTAMVLEEPVAEATTASVSVEPSKEDVMKTFMKPVTATPTMLSREQKKKKMQSQVEKDTSIFERTKANLRDIKELILHTELAFSTFLETRICRWAKKEIRLQFRKQVEECTEPREFQILLDQMNEAFTAVDHMYLKEPKQNANAPVGTVEFDPEYGQSDEEQSMISENEESFQGIAKQTGKVSANDALSNEILTFETMETHPMMRCKKLPMRTWGASAEKVRKNWQSLEVSSLVSAYFSTYLFCMTIHRFLLRKSEQQHHHHLSNLAKQQQLQQQQQAIDETNAYNSSVNHAKQAKSYSIKKHHSDFDVPDTLLRRSHRQKDSRRPNMAESNYDDFEDEDDEENNGQEASQNDDGVSPHRLKNNKHRRLLRKRSMSSEDGNKASGADANENEELNDSLEINYKRSNNKTKEEAYEIDEEEDGDDEDNSKGADKEANNDSSNEKPSKKKDNQDAKTNGGGDTHNDEEQKTRVGIRGRPKGSKNGQSKLNQSKVIKKSKEQTTTITPTGEQSLPGVAIMSASGVTTNGEEAPVKRGRGRPPKYPKTVPVVTVAVADNSLNGLVGVNCSTEPIGDLLKTKDDSEEEFEFGKQQTVQAIDQ